MINASSIPEKTAKHVSKILKEDSEPDARAEAKATIDYYLKNYPQVQIVRCNKCKKDLCLEILDPSAIPKYSISHHQGMRRIELSGSPLWESRKRLDGVMGYHCACGNNTINAAVELGLLPHVNNPTGPDTIPSIEPHHEAMVRLEIAKQHYKPDVEVNGDETRIETFTVKRIK